MFRQVRFQTGEISDIVKEMKKGSIPCMDVFDEDELNWVFDQLSKNGIYKVDDIPYDKNARDRIEESDFEYRIAFYEKPVKSDQIEKKKLMYIDFYFEPEYERTYDPMGEM